LIYIHLSPPMCADLFRPRNKKKPGTYRTLQYGRHPYPYDL
jgi:hypothetical protein